MLVDGEVEILERKVILKPGEIFGELALFTGSGKRTA
jgi:CRP-like cAMP-binding protein